MVQIIKSNWWWGSWWGGGEWDMKRSVYDPNNVGKNVYDYTYFINKPTIPTKTSDLNNDSGFITNSALSGYQTTANIKTNLTSPDNTHYPSTKAVSDALASKQWTLTAGTGINITGNVISATWGGWGWKQAFFKTQAEYDILPSSKNSDGNLYIIVDTHPGLMSFAELIQLTPQPTAILNKLNIHPKEYAEYYYANEDIQMQEIPSSELPRVDAYYKGYSFINGLYIYLYIDTNLTEQELSDIGIPQEYIETVLAWEWAGMVQPN